jgi:hypothetical protein
LPASPGRVVYSLELTPRERDLFARLADEAGVTLSEAFRHGALLYLLDFQPPGSSPEPEPVEPF